MIRIATIIGARPQIIKAAAISRVLKEQYPDIVRELIVHTGQHYDDNMSAIFFDQLGIPSPDVNLAVGSNTHGKQTALMIDRIEQLLTEEKPDFILIYGDTNSTLAAAVASSKLNIPIAHVEAGLRSFNKSMPEEINRIVADHLSTLLFTPTETGLQNLIREGFKPGLASPYNPDHQGVFHCGDVMYDNMSYFSKKAEKESNILSRYDLHEKQFILATIHRDNNTDDKDRLNGIFSALDAITQIEPITIILPLHPRTLKLLPQNLEPGIFDKITHHDLIRIIPPASFFDIIMLEKGCRMIITDSGGVQKEAFFNQKPCIILRPETEWTEIVEHHCGILTDADSERIIKAFEHYRENHNLEFPAFYGDGNAASFICSKIIEST